MTGTSPGQPRLDRRTRTHPQSLSAQRARLAEPHRPAPIRGLSTQGTSEPAVALLDAFATVVDIVCFYSERHATEGYLRTATERRSLRELARTLGHELRPGLSATADLVVHVEDIDAGDRQATVPAGTPVQSVPGPGELPQVFETTGELQAHAAWNAVPAAVAEPQVLRYGAREVWLRGGDRGLRRGDALLIAGDERLGYRPETSTGVDEESFDLRRLDEVTVDPPGHLGWTLLRLDRTLGFLPFRPLVGTRRQRVWHLTGRGRLFGATAPDPGLLRLGPEGQAPPGSVRGRDHGSGEHGSGEHGSGEQVRWDGFDLPDPQTPTQLELAGDQPTVIPGSWLVLEQDDLVEAYVVRDVQASGMLRFGISGPVTRVRLDIAEKLERYDRRAALVHFGSEELPEARFRPRDPIGGGDDATVDLEPFTPLLPTGRRVLLTGTDAEGHERAEARTVLDCREVRVETGRQGEPLVQAQTVVRLTLSEPTAHRYLPETLRVHGNLASATHGTTVEQVLGSGDGRTPHRRFALRQAPLTHVRTGTAVAESAGTAGALAALQVRVDGVRWEQVPGFEDAGPLDRVYRLEHTEPAPPPDGGPAGPAVTEVVFGDGTRGAVPQSGTENITAVYRAGIGAEGALRAGQLVLPVRRPLGIREVTHPGATRDWAPPETLDQARTTAPRRIRTLDRVVSVADFADLARGYAGVGQARADQVWDGRTSSVVVSLRGMDGTEPAPELLAGLTARIDRVRDPRLPFRVVPAVRVGCGVEVGVAVCPDHRREEVLAGVGQAVVELHGGTARRIGQPLTAAEVLVTVRSVPGVLHCTMPVLRRLDAAGTGTGTATGTPSEPAAEGEAGAVLVARGPRWAMAGRRPGARPTLQPGELLAVLPAGVVLRETG